MNRKSTTKNGIALKIMLFVLISTLGSLATVAQTNWYVNDNSGTGDTYTTAVGAVGNTGTSADPFATIAAAITAASAGDVIYVDAGTYTEEIWIDKPLTLRGPNANIAGNGSRVAEALVQFPLASVVSGDALIYVGDAANGVMTGVTIEGFDLRCQDATIPKYLNVLYTYRINNLTVRNNRMYSSEVPIYLLTSGISDYHTGLLVEGNYVDCGPNVNNRYNRGIYVQATSGTIQDNQFMNTSIGIQYMPYSHVTSGLIRRNTVTASTIGLYHNYHINGGASVTWEQNEVSVAPNPQTGLSAQVDGANTTPTIFRGIHVISFGIQGTGASPSVTFQNNSINAANPGGTTSTVFRAFYMSATVNGTVNLSNNSFTNFTNGIVRNTDATTTTINATCNWWGSGLTANVTTAASSATSFNPWLNSGTDANAAIGFQPASGTCTGGTSVVLNSATGTNAACSSSGSIAVNFSGGVPPYSVTWTGGGSATGITSSPYNITGLSAGSYTATITDANGSTATSSSVTISYMPVTNATSGLSYSTIQAAINAASAGDVINICAGTFTENIDVNKRVTLIGAGTTSTILTTASAGSVITITGSGADASNRLTIKDLRVTGASADGIAIAPTTAGGYYTFDNVLSNSNNNGIHVSGTTAVTDLAITNSTISSNSNAGIRVASACPSLTTLNVTGCNITSNQWVGFDYNPSSTNNTGTDFNFTNTNFTNNCASNGSSAGMHDLSIWGFKGNLSMTNVTITSNHTVNGHGLVISPGTLTGIAAGTISINGLTISGTVPKSGFYIGPYNNLSTISLNNVDVSAVSAGNRAGWAGTAQMVVEATGSNPINLGNTTLKTFALWNAAGATATSVNFKHITTGASLDRSVLADCYQIENQVVHALDAAGPGLARVKAGNIYVTSTSASIQRGIDAATAGDLVNVDAGTYTAQAVTVNKRVDICGAGATTIIQNAAATIFTFTAAGSGASSSSRTYLRKVKLSGASKGIYTQELMSYLTLDSLTVDGMTTYGIHLNNTSGVMNDWVISNCTFNANSSAFYGATQSNINGLTITSSTFTNQTASPISIYCSSTNPGGCNNLSITNNTFTNNANASNNSAAIYIEKASNAVISGNTMTNNGTPANARGIILNTKYANHNFVTINGNIFSETRGLATSGYGMQTAGRNDAPSYSAVPGSLANLTITNNEISGFYLGISLENNVIRSSATVTNNKLLNCAIGFNTSGATAGSTTTITNNSFSGSTYVLSNADAGSSLTATCNYMGTLVANDIPAKIYGSNVTYSPWLTNSTDADVAIGFQPVSGACNGTPVVASLTAKTDVSCFGGSNGSIDISVADGVSPYTYLWSNGATTEDISGLAAGTYSVLVTDANGSKSNLSVTISQPSAITGSESATICSSEAPYSWNGNQYSTAGTYTYVATAANGCDSTVTLNLSITASTSNTTTASNCDSYVWSVNGQTYTSSGTYSSVSGCHTEILNLTITSSTSNTTVASECVTYTWTVNSQTYTSSGSYTSVSGCHTEILNLTIKTPTSSVTNTTVCASNTPYSWNGGSYSASGTYTYSTTNAAGCDSTATLNLTVTPFLSNPAATVTQPTCASATGTITVTTPTGAGYTYSIGGAYQSSVTFSGVAAGTYTLSVKNTAGCTSAQNTSVTVNAQPTIPSATTVTGQVNVCNVIGTNNALSYTASAPGATSYTWTLPPNTVLVSGQGTATISVKFLSGFLTQSNKQLRVVATSSCGSNTAKIYYLSAQLPTTPSSILASTSNVCPSIGTALEITYTIPKSTGADSYIWNAQTGTTTISHPNGTGEADTVVTVSFASNFTSSSITVQAVNTCGTSGTRSLFITRNNPSTPSIISGPTNACSYMGTTGVDATYSVTAVSNVVSYNWTLPSGVTNVVGQGTNTISFRYPAGFVNGVVSVTASNGCGTSAARSLSVSRLLPPATGNIDVINNSACPTRSYTYSVAAIPVNATSLEWTVPTGGTIVSGQGTSSITVTYSSSVIDGYVKVRSVNNCGVSSYKSSQVRLAPCPSGPVATSTKGQSIVADDVMNVNVFPNPSTSNFNVKVITVGQGKISARLMDLQGRFIQTVKMNPNESVNLGSELKAGSYLLEVRQGNNIKTTRVVKF